MAATTLYEFYGGQVPPIAERAKMYEAFGLGAGSSYTGTKDQNIALLGKLQTTAPSQPKPSPQPIAQQPTSGLGSVAQTNALLQQASQQTGIPAPQFGSTAQPQAQPQSAPGAQPALPPMQQQAPQGPTFNLAPRQQQQQPQPTLNLPQMQPGGGSSLLDFANALDAATNMAKQKRNELSLQIMGSTAPPGTMMASDFSGILSSLNRASDNTAANLTNRAIEAATPSYGTMQLGDNLYQIQYDASGRAIGQTLLGSQPSQQNQNSFQQQQIGDALYEFEYSPQGQLVGQRQIGTMPGGSSSGEYETRQIAGVGLIAYDPKDPSNYQVIVPEPASEQKADLRSVSGVGLVSVKPDGSYEVVVPEKDKPTQTDKKDALKQDIAAVQRQLNASRGSDGYVNSAAYLDAYDAWEGTDAEFFKEFPTSMLNPQDPTVPDWMLDY